MDSRRIIQEESEDAMVYKLHYVPEEKVENQ